MAVQEWLPSLVLFNESDGDWDKYLSLIYSYFKADFIDSNCNYRGIKIAIKRHPLIDDKEATFFHLITEGKVEKARKPDLSRCERIRWPKPIIQKVPNNDIKVWKNRRNDETRLCIWFEEAEYLVVLAERKNYLLLWTAYTVTQKHRKVKLNKEYEDSLKS